MKIAPAKKTEEVIKEFYRTILSSYAKHTLSYDELRAEVAIESTKLLPLFRDGEMAATCSLFVEKTDSQNNPYYASIHRLTVNPKFRGLGIGTRANRLALEYASQIGCKHVYCAAVINVEGQGGGNNPNLAQLNICLNKLDYRPTGFRLVDLPDFGREIDRQFTSTIVLWKSIKNSKRNDQLYSYNIQKLTNYYKIPSNFKIIPTRTDKRLYKYAPKKTGAIQASSTNIDDFRGSDFLPSYFLPMYGDGGKTVFFGFKYQKILTRTSTGVNVADINYTALQTYLRDSRLIHLLEKIQGHIVKRGSVVYSDPSLKIKNL